MVIEELKALTQWTLAFSIIVDEAAQTCAQHGPIRNMAAANQHKLIFVKQTNEPHREKEHVDISDTAKFQSSGPSAGEMADI